MPGIAPLLGTPLHEDCSAESVFHDPALAKDKETVFLAAMIPILLSVNHHREAFCQVAFSGISESTKHAKLRVLSVDSLKLPIVKFHQFCT